MNCHVILLLVTICVTSALGQDMKNSAKRGRVIRFRNTSPVLPVRRSSRGQSVPVLRSRSRGISRPNARFIILPPRVTNVRNSHAKRPTPRLMTPAVNRGTSSLRAINTRSSRNFRRTGFFTVPARSRSLTKSFRSNTRLSAPRLSMPRSSWSRRFFPRDTGKRINTSPVQSHPTKVNVSGIRSSFGDKASSTRLTESQRGSISGRSGFQSPVRATLSRSGDARAPSAHRSFFSHPRATNLGFGSRITNNRQISGQFGSRIPHRMLRTMSGIRIFTPFSRLVSKDARSNFRSSSARSPVSIAIPGFRSFDRRISSGSWAGASSGHTASKSTPLIDNKSLSRFGDASIPTTFMESSSAGISQSGQSSTKVDGVSNPKPFIADQSGGTAGTGNGIASGSVSTVAGSASVSSTADKATVANQALMPRGLSNAGGAPSGNAAQASASTINAGGPNAKVPAPNNQRLGGVAGPTQSKTSSSTGTTSPNIEKLAWLTEIVNTREALEEGMDGGGLIPRLQKSGPHTFADLMAALRKGSHFNDEIISDMQTEGQWDQLLNAAGISPKDRTEHGGSKLGWLTRIVNKREGLEEAIDDRGVVMRLQRTGPHTFTELMAALRNGSHFSDAVIADMKSEGQWDQILRASGINPSDIGKQDIMSKTKNTATNIKVKTDQAAALKSTNADVQAGPHLSTGQQIMTSGSATNVDVQAGHHHLSTGQQIMTSGSATNVDVQAGHHHLSTGQQIMTSGSATPVDQTANSKSAVVSQKEANTDGSKTITGGSSGTVSQSKVSLKDVQTRSVPENGIASDCSGNAAGTNGKNSGQKYW